MSKPTPNPVLSEIRDALELKESDKTWMDIDAAIQKLTKLYQTEPAMLPQLNKFMAKMRPHIESSVSFDASFKILFSSPFYPDSTALSKRFE